jgi:hypothetical protein
MYFLHLGSKAKFLQGSTINHQSSTMQPSTINNATINNAAINNAVISHQSSVISHQPTSIIP